MTRNLRRAAAVVAMTVATLAGAGAAPADAAIGTATFCANVTAGSSGFTDIAGVATAQRNDIECLAASGITTGTSPTTYGPSGTVFRDGMATFVAKLVDLANTLELTTLAALPTNPPNAFTDDNGNTHEPNINRLAAANIVAGKTPTTYGPNGPGNEVSRAQMATFLVKALEYLRGTSLAAGPDAFTDDAGNTHAANIDKLAAIDVVDGVSATSYNPNGPVSRAQMASFLVRSLAYLHSQGLIAVLPSSLQTIAVSPTGTQTNETDGVAGGEITFTASNIAVTDVDLALFPCENVTFSQSGTSFADANPNDAVADPGGDLVEADIVSVNGSAQPLNTEFLSGVPVTNGAISFQLDSPQLDCVVAVVSDDADDDDKLDLNASDRPTERFGPSGQVVFVPPPAASGPMDENVFSNTEASDQFIGCELGGVPGAGATPESGPNAPNATDCATFTYDSNDLFFIDANNNLTGDAPGESVSLAVFEAALTPGDDVAGNYDATAGNQGRFVLVDEAPTAPTGVSAGTVDADTLIVTFDEVAGADSYKVYRNADPGPLSCPAFTTTGGDPYVPAGTGTVAGGSADADAGSTNTLTDNGLTASTRYCYVVTSVDEGDESGPSSSANATTSADTVPPLAVDTEVTTDNANDAPGLNDGDVIQICFDQDIANPTDGNALQPNVETMQVQDADGTKATLTNGTTATFRFAATPINVAAPPQTTCAASRVLEIVANGNPPVDPASPGTVAGVQFPATVIASSNVEDTSGTVWQPQPPATGQEVVVDAEAGAEPN